MKVSTIKNNPKNPRKITDVELDRLKASVERDPEFMVLRPIVVDDDMMVLGGNQRLKAIKKLGMKDIPDNWVVKASNLTEEQRKRFILVDNAPDGMSGSWDMPALELDFAEFDLGELGIASFEIENTEGRSEEDIEKEMEEDEEKGAGVKFVDKFNDERDELPIPDLLRSVDLVKVSFSGGKDSVATVLYINQVVGVPKEKILLEHYFNPFEWNDTEEYSREFADKFGVKIDVYGKEGAQDFMTRNLREKGLPALKNLWCRGKYKTAVFEKVSRKYKKDGVNYIQAVGVRAEESTKRAKMPDRGLFKGLQPACFPIFNFTQSDVLDLVIKNKVKIHHAYRYFARTGCPYCPMCSAKEFLVLKDKYPYMWERALNLFALAMESPKYRETTFPLMYIKRVLGIGSERSRKGGWTPPDGLEFWLGNEGR
jgi:3'-phosphoadenosine 5'-phosphosulfate sulfotransferase (PAPS reductase)/FAD synthetase